MVSFDCSAGVQLKARLMWWRCCLVPVWWRLLELASRFLIFIYILFKNKTKNFSSNLSQVKIFFLVL